MSGVGRIRAIHQPAAAGPLTWTVPENQCWQLLCGHIIFTTSATGGNRWVNLRATSPDGHIIWDTHAGAKQGSSTVSQYNYRSGEGRETAFFDDDIMLTIPRFAVMLPGYTLTLSDEDQIDEAGDTYSAHGLIMVTSGSDLNLGKMI